MRIPVVAGEAFSEQTESQPVIIINQTMANRFWPNESALGKRIKLGNADSKSPWFTVKGVVKDSAQGALDTQTRPEAYFAMGQLAGRYRRMNLAIRSTVDPKTLVSAIQNAIREVDRDQPVYQIQTLEELITESVGPRRFALFMLILFGVLALILASTGIYGVISYAVAQRTQELGIRLALGASASDVMRLVLNHCLKLTVMGIAVGLAGAFALTRLMKSLLFEVTTTDVTTFSMVSAVLIVVALIACYLPARRATKVDPLVALRYE
jgi:predicted permease